MGYSGRPFRFDLYSLEGEKLGSQLQQVTLMSDQCVEYKARRVETGGTELTKTTLEPNSRSLLDCMQIVTTRRNVKKLWDDVNFYAQLELDAEDVWRMKEGEQTALIKT